LPAFFQEAILMTTAFSRRAALAGLAAIAPATVAATLPVATGDDPFLIALAAHHKADAEWTAAIDREDEDGPYLNAAHETLLAALRTTPTTDAGRAVLFEMLAADRHPTEHDFIPLFAEGGPIEAVVCAALTSAAEHFRHRAAVQA
jgi:hypothetical protein